MITRGNQTARRRVLITTPWLAPGCAIEPELVQAGFEVGYASSLGAWPALADVDAVIAGTEPVTAADLDRAERLRIIVRTGVGYDNIDVAHATGAGIAVSTTPGSNRRSVAELVIGFMIDLARGISGNVASVRSGGWQRTNGREIEGAVLGIVGLGSIGKCVADLALALGMRVVATDPHVDEEFARDRGIEVLGIDELLACSDFVSLHLMLTEETRHLIDARRIAFMKPGAYLINTSRGGIVDEAALADALRERRIGGAALDVLEHEPPDAADAIRRVDGLRITAHIGGATTESWARSAVSAAEQIIGFFEAREPIGLVNPGYRAASPLGEEAS